VILVLLNFSCEKDRNPKINFEFRATGIISYPDKHISITFDVVPEVDKEHCTINWYSPDSLKGNGPYTINISGNLMLDFEIYDNQNTTQRFQYEIKADTIDSLKYDYRNNYIGTYSCSAAYSNNGSTEYYKDTLTVVKNNAFNMLNILTKQDIANNYEGSKMIYLNSNGFNSSPAGGFFGYHSGASFYTDSIHYATSGPLGYYYSIVYDGVRISR